MIMVESGSERIPRSLLRGKRANHVLKDRSFTGACSGESSIDIDNCHLRGLD